MFEFWLWFGGCGNVQSCRWLNIFSWACHFPFQFQPKHADGRFLQNVGNYVGNKTNIAEGLKFLMWRKSHEILFTSENRLLQNVDHFDTCSLVSFVTESDLKLWINAYVHWRILIFCLREFLALLLYIYSVNLAVVFPFCNHWELQR